ncbi:hypothetical protein D3C76_1010230 [compost metagenome]
MEDLPADMSFEHVGEILGRGAVHRPEVLGVDQVVDQLARVGLDQHGVDVPVMDPVGVVHLRQVRNDHAVLGRAPFRVVPDKQQVVFLAGQPAARPRLGRYALAIGDFHALATGVVLPVVERAHHGVVLDGALGQVGTHMRAERIENADGTGTVGEGHQARAEHIQGMQLAITVVVGHAQAVPAPGVTVGALGAFDGKFGEFGHVLVVPVLDTPVTGNTPAVPGGIPGGYL